MKNYVKLPTEDTVRTSLQTHQTAVQLEYSGLASLSENFAHRRRSLSALGILDFWNPVPQFNLPGQPSALHI